MAKRRWNSERFEKWENETHIPEDVMKMVNIVCEQIGIAVYEKTIEYRNRGGYIYAFAKGFEISHCTSSYETGPTEDMTPVFMKWLGGLGFHVENSYGDNGLDSATNWHDTWWTKEIAYDATMVYDERFWDWEDDEWDD